MLKWKTGERANKAKYTIKQKAIKLPRTYAGKKLFVTIIYSYLFFFPMTKKSPPSDPKGENNMPNCDKNLVTTFPIFFIHIFKIFVIVFLALGKHAESCVKLCTLQKPLKTMFFDTFRPLDHNFIF